MVANVRNLDGVKRPMKTFEADAKMFDLLEKAAALRTNAQGGKVYEADIIRDTLLAHAATDALARAEVEFVRRIAELPAEARDEATRAFDMRRRELLAVCEHHKIPVSGIASAKLAGKGKK